MHYRHFGNSDIRLSAVGLGTVKLGRNQGVKYPSGFELPSDREAADLLALAAELGITLLDTAPAYGSAETRLGPLLRGQRQRWVLCSKVGEEFDNGRSWFDFSAAHTRFSVERSLQRLETDYLDIVLVHSDGDDQRIAEQEEVLDTLATLKREGKLRAFGISSKTVEGAIACLQHSDGVMATYNPGYTEEKPLLDYCAQHGKGVLLKKVLGSGHLCLADGDPVQQAMDFAFSHAAVSSVVLGTLNPDHLRDNVTKALIALARGR